MNEQVQQENCARARRRVAPRPAMRDYSWDRTGQGATGACLFCGDPIDRKRPASVACDRCVWRGLEAAPVYRPGPPPFQQFGKHHDRRWTPPAPNAE